MDADFVCRAVLSPPSSLAADDMLRVAQVKDDAWFPKLFAHLRGQVNLQHLPFRPLVKWRISDPLIHALCNVLPNVVHETSLISTKSMMWIPVQCLEHREIVRGLSDGLVYV
jgi:hypothetical protein